MNITHLRYILEIARTSSISRAAANLYVSQPTLSRALKEVEHEVSFEIFQRTSSGVVPTPRGAEVITRAKLILEQMDELEHLSEDGSERYRCRFLAPRASYIAHAFTELAAELDSDRALSLDYRETNNLEAMRAVASGEADLAVIRFTDEHRDFFEHKLKEMMLSGELFWRVEFVVLMPAAHPLAGKNMLSRSDLKDSILLDHGDTYFNNGYEEGEKGSRSDRVIRIYDRGIQFELLSRLKDSYIWVSPMPKDVLERFGLVQRRCCDRPPVYEDVLIYRQNYQLTELDRRLISKLEQVKKETIELLEGEA